jgi:hypothetical protein
MLKERYILEAAEAEKTTLVLMGWNGYTTTRERIMGEVTEKVARYAHTPVMIVQRYAGSVKNACKKGDGLGVGPGLGKGRDDAIAFIDAVAIMTDTDSSQREATAR